jgi:Carboxypeptidase regulatory-like domain/TonB dependent receptor
MPTCFGTLALAFLLLLPSSSMAQSSSANLTGTIKDTSGGVLPGVSVSARNVATNETRTTVSETDGLYRITSLPRGTYNVKAELPGFKTLEKSGVLLTVGETVRLDFTLDVGQVAETIQVQGQSPLVNTEEGRLSYLVDEKRVAELPLNGRNAFQLMELQPGASANPGNAVLGGSAGGNTAFINGQSNRANNFLLDGTDNNDQFTAGRTAVNPNVDLIQEFRLSTNNFSAEFGRNSASMVNVVTKSGSNALHGTAYEFLRNDAFDSKSILATKKDPLRFNQFGATNGGPVLKNKLFYFAAYEGLRLDRGTTLVRTVETPEFRQLVAQRFPNSIANFLFSHFPAPAPTSNIRDIGQPVTGPQTQNILNDPSVATNPNYVATGGGLYRNVRQGVPDGIPDIGTAAIPVLENTTANQVSGRLDYELSQGQRLFGRFTYDHNLADDLQSVPRAGFNQPVDQNGKNLTLGHTWILSNRTVNEARFGLSRRARGLGAMNEGVPSLGFDDGLLAFGNFSTNPAVFIQKTFHWNDVVTMTRGDHAVKWGGEWRYIQDDSDFAVKRGGYQFFNIFDFAQDEPRAVTIMGIDPRIGQITPNVRNFRFNELGVFLQDDWKIRSNLTVNLGLRYEWFGRPGEVNNLLTNMIPGPGSTIFEQVKTATVGHVDQVVPNDNNDFGPRIGAAWDPRGDGKISVRGGYGIMYERLFNNSITNIRFNPPFYSFAVANPIQVGSQAGIPIAYGPRNPDGTIRNEPITITGPNQNIGVPAGLPVFGNIIGWNPAFGTSQQSLRVPDPFGHDSYFHNWFGGVQIQLTNDIAFETNYVGNVGRNLGHLVDYNTIEGDLVDGHLDRLNPAFGGINFRAMNARSQYNGVQLQLNKRYSHGFTGQFSYTYGRAYDNGSDVQVGGTQMDAYRQDLEWAPADFDLRHRVVVNWLFELPWLKDSTGVTHAVLAGWQINGITQWQTGYPFAVNTSAAYPTGDYNADGNNNDRPNLPSFGLNLPDTSQSAYINGLFKASDFPKPTSPAGWALGTLPRNPYRGPHYKTTDLSLFKTFQVAGQTRIQFRAEAFNVFNSANLYKPTNGVGTNLANANFGKSTQSFPGREIQFALKFLF